MLVASPLLPVVELSPPSLPVSVELESLSVASPSVAVSDAEPAPEVTVLRVVTTALPSEVKVLTTLPVGVPVGVAEPELLPFSPPMVVVATGVVTTEPSEPVMVLKIVETWCQAELDSIGYRQRRCTYRSCGTAVSASGRGIAARTSGNLNTGV